MATKKTDLTTQRHEMEKVLYGCARELIDYAKAFEVTGNEKMSETLSLLGSEIEYCASLSSIIAREELQDRFCEANESIGNILIDCLSLTKGTKK